MAWGWMWDSKRESWRKPRRNWLNLFEDVFGNKEKWISEENIKEIIGDNDFQIIQLYYKYSWTKKKIAIKFAVSAGHVGYRIRKSLEKIKENVENV